jgi:hypothetical protein
MLHHKRHCDVIRGYRKDGQRTGDQGFKGAERSPTTRMTVQSGSVQRHPAVTPGAGNPPRVDGGGHNQMAQQQMAQQSAPVRAAGKGTSGIRCRLSGDTTSSVSP